MSSFLENVEIDDSDIATPNAIAINTAKEANKVSIALLNVEINSNEIYEKNYKSKWGICLDVDCHAACASDGEFKLICSPLSLEKCKYFFN